jgi:DNA-binding response OmpR family regulator
MTPRSRFNVIPLSEIPCNESETLTEQRRPVVLVVDDEKVIADTVSIILSKSGFAALTAYDGETAMEIASVIPPELLITDVVMRGMNGIELAIAMVQSVPDCKILLFSGQAATVDLLATANEAGHNFALLTKPVHPTDLLRRVSNCLDLREPPITLPLDLPSTASFAGSSQRVVIRAKSAIRNDRNPQPPIPKTLSSPQTT